MKNIILSCFAIISAFTSFSQKVEVLNKRNFEYLHPVQKFAFVEPALDTNALVFVATFRARDKIKKANIESLYFAIREKAKEIGTNCYRIRSYTLNVEKNEAVLMLDGYFATDSLLKINTDSHEKNVVFIFGNEKDDGNSETLKVNGITHEIKSGTFFKVIIKEGETVKLSKGGFTGEMCKLSWQKDKQPQFYTLSGFGIDPYSFIPSGPYRGDKIGFNTGRINPIENVSLGLLLTQLLPQGGFTDR